MDLWKKLKLFSVKGFLFVLRHKVGFIIFLCSFVVGFWVYSGTQSTYVICASDYYGGSYQVFDKVSGFEHDIAKLIFKNKSVKYVLKKNSNIREALMKKQYDVGMGFIYDKCDGGYYTLPIKQVEIYEICKNGWKDGDMIISCNMYSDFTLQCTMFDTTTNAFNYYNTANFPIKMIIDSVSYDHFCKQTHHLYHEKLTKKHTVSLCLMCKNPSILKEINELIKAHDINNL